MSRIGICIVVALLMMVGTVSASTVAYWRFEEGVPGGFAQKPLGMLDSSGNGNHLEPFDTNGAAAGFTYSGEVASPVVAQTGAANGLSIRNSGQWPSSTTMSSVSMPTVDVETISPVAWTVEASFKAENFTGWGCMVGRDSWGLNTAGGGAHMQSSFYLQVDPGNAPGVRFVDQAGYYHDAIAAPGLIQEFDAATDPTGATAPWYHIAAVSDGATLSLWLAEEGQAYQLVAEKDLLASGSLDTRMSVGTGTRDNVAWGHEWHGGAWTVGRGLWDSWHSDRWYGFIDEVRISDSALSSNEFLGVPEPGTMLLLGLGAAAGLRRRRRA